MENYNVPLNQVRLSFYALLAVLSRAFLSSSSFILFYYYVCRPPDGNKSFIISLCVFINVVVCLTYLKASFGIFFNNKSFTLRMELNEEKQNFISFSSCSLRYLEVIKFRVKINFVKFVRWTGGSSYLF